MLPLAFHKFPEDTTVKYFVKRFLEFRFGLSASHGVKIDVRFKPGFLIELQDGMNGLNLQAGLQV